MQISIDEVIDDRFVIQKYLGTGASGSVYKALQTGLNRAVALKFLRWSANPSTEQIDRMQREATVLSNLNHRNIVGFYGVGYWRHSPYFILELVQGRTLSHVLAEEKKIDVQRLFRIVMQCCHALEYAHNLGVIHRDLKPENILLCDDPETDNEQIRIIDFGLAKLIDDSGQRITATGMVVGTIMYMSPEQFLGKPADARSDIYSMGAILYECLSGNPPFNGTDDFSLMYSHVKSDPPPLTCPDVLSKKLFLELDKVIRRAMAKEPDQRYPNAGAMLKDLDHVQRGGTISFIPAKPMSPLLKPPLPKLPLLRHSLVAILVFSAIALLLLCVRAPQSSSVSKVSPQTPSSSELYRAYLVNKKTASEEDQPFTDEGLKELNAIIAADMRDHLVTEKDRCIAAVYLDLLFNYVKADKLADAWKTARSPFVQEQLRATDPSLYDKMLLRIGQGAVSKARLGGVDSTSLLKEIAAELDARGKELEGSGRFTARSLVLSAGFIIRRIPPDRDMLNENTKLLASIATNCRDGDALMLADAFSDLANAYFWRLDDRVQTQYCLDQSTTLIKQATPGNKRSAIIRNNAILYWQLNAWKEIIDTLALTSGHGSIELAELSCAYENVDQPVQARKCEDQLLRSESLLADSKHMARLLSTLMKTVNAHEPKEYAEQFSKQLKTRLGWK